MDTNGGNSRRLAARERPALHARGLTLSKFYRHSRTQAQTRTQTQVVEVDGLDKDGTEMISREQEDNKQGKLLDKLIADTIFRFAGRGRHPGRTGTVICMEITCLGIANHRVN